MGPDEHRRSPLLLGAVAAACLGVACWGAATRSPDGTSAAQEGPESRPAPTAPGEGGPIEPPPGYEQILPRGRIAAVREPEFVPADEAELPDDAWVLGVVVEGQAKAYGLNLLNRHEVVNDRAGDTRYAAVW